MLSQIKIPRQQAPAQPPTCVTEKKMKKATPNPTQIHGLAAGFTSRNKIAAGNRIKMKYSNVLKTMGSNAQRAVFNLPASPTINNKA